ncbi:MAG: plasmid pRiA4b ORF-3 family protein [Candidatus Sericytochromatia bacterium]
MYAPFAMIFPEESDRQRLSFRLNARNPFGLAAGGYELYDIYPAMQETPLFDVFLNVTNDASEVLATLFCQLNAVEHEINLSLSELHLQRPVAQALLEAVEAQFNHSRGQQWAEILLKRAERMQTAFLETLPGQKPRDDASDPRLLRDEALEMLMAHSGDPEQQEALIDTLLEEMRLLMLSELEAHRRSHQREQVGKIIQFPGRRQSDWQAVPWLELQVSLADLPEIWRRVRVPECLTLTQLHRVLQTAMGWQDRGVWRFVHPRGEYVSHAGQASKDSLWDELNADTARLGELLTRKGARIEYEYAGYWNHQIRVLQRQRPGATLLELNCEDGAMACPPEDCGGPEGYRQLQHVLVKKRRSRADKLLMAELAGYDPLRFEREPVNRQLASLAQEFRA